MTSANDQPRMNYWMTDWTSDHHAALAGGGVRAKKRRDDECEAQEVENQSFHFSAPFSEGLLVNLQSVKITLGICHDDVGSDFAGGTVDDLGSDLHIWSVAKEYPTNSKSRVIDVH
jgi:hypothetical protein